MSARRRRDDASPVPALLDELDGLADEPAPAGRDDAFPFVLAAGDRRSSTANTLFRDPSWRKQDKQGALRLSPADAERLGLGAGDRARVTTKRGEGVAFVEVSDTMRDGHVSLPNGFGLDAYPNESSDGMLDKVEYQPNPTRYEYRVTAKGRDSGTCWPRCGDGGATGSGKKANRPLRSSIVRRVM